MATLVNIRIHTQSKAVPSTVDISIIGVSLVNNAIIASSSDGVRYELGVISSENIVVETPHIGENCGSTTTNANVFATLLQGVDGVTPDMSDYYDKVEVDGKLDKKQDTISDLATIRSGASKGATALQLGDVDSELTFSRNPIQNQTVMLAFGQMDALKQDVISDLATIRDGAAKGATALQEHQPLKTINGESIVGEGNIKIEGGTATQKIDARDLRLTTLEPNIMYDWSGSSLVSLTIPRLGRAQAGYEHKWMVRLTCGDSSQVTIPFTVTWLNGVAPSWSTWSTVEFTFTKGNDDSAIYGEYKIFR